MRRRCDTTQMGRELRRIVAPQWAPSDLETKIAGEYLSKIKVKI